MKFAFQRLLARRRSRRFLILAACVFGAVLAALAGLVLGFSFSQPTAAGTRARPAFGWLLAGFADWLGRISYDVPFVVRGDRPRDDACIVYIDEHAAAVLNQRVDAWDRAKHSQLVRRLTADGARAILFDIVFADPWPTPSVDADFAAALQENGRTFLGAALEIEDGPGAGSDGVRLIRERVLPPTATLRRAAAGWGLLAFRPVDPDYGVRRIYAGTDTVEAATWKVARALRPDDPALVEARHQPRWINYHGRADLLPNIGYDQALSAETPGSFFKDKIVVVGGRSTLGGLRFGKDDFRGPYGLLGGQVFKGPEVHLTVLLNLLHGEWLTRFTPRQEVLALALFGVVLGGLLPLLRPPHALIAAIAAAGTVTAVALHLVNDHRLWFAWAVPAFVQTPVAVVWAIAARYLIEERRRNLLRQAFAHYLSPAMADRIADADFNLELGGTVVEATVLFTDLENFTPLAEELDDPERVSTVLTTYFTETTGHILENGGTILKYLGDSVQAVWGAPLPDPEHARRAAKAALRLHETGNMDVLGHPLRTRIGINTGPVLAGNLGSRQRFDYATTGDAVNFASRLEGLNKYLGTHILVSDTVARELGPEFVLRCVGRFRVVGKKKERGIHELLPENSRAAEWLGEFARGLAAFQQGDLAVATEAFRAVEAKRGTDGPSRFYLAQIASLSSAPLPADWSGIVELSAK